MTLDRRAVLAGIAGAAVSGVAPRAATAAQPLSASGLDAAQFGVRAGAADDQSRVLQRAIDQAAAQRLPLVLGPGTNLVTDLRLPAGAQLVGVRGASRLVLARAGAIMSAEHADDVSLSGLSFDGRKIAVQGRGLVSIFASGNLRIRGCAVLQAGAHGISVDQVSGELSDNTVTDAADTAIFSQNARALLITDNIVRGAGNGGIRIFRSDKGDDGTIVRGNRIEETSARGGGNGENGNAINVFRAANVIVQGNRIRKAAFSAIRGNAASNIIIEGNSCSDLGEVALYSEFAFEGAVIANNVVDGASAGVSVTNFDKGGRLALVQGNIFRNIDQRAPATGAGGQGVGIAVEADTAVTGNVVDNAASVGISLGFGQFLRDVTVTGNIVRSVPYGIGVSVVKGAGHAVISDNLISGARRAAIVGMEWGKAVTGDLVKEGVGTYEQLTVSNNRMR